MGILNYGRHFALLALLAASLAAMHRWSSAPGILAEGTTVDVVRLSPARDTPAGAAPHGIRDGRNRNFGVDCLSCHRAHGTEYKHLALYATSTELCTKCHEQYKR